MEPAQEPEDATPICTGTEEKTRPRSSMLLMLIAIIIVGALGFMIFHMVTTPHVPHSGSPIQPQNSSP